VKIHVISIWPLNEEQKSRVRRLGDLVYYDAVLADPDIVEKCRGAEILIITPRVDRDIVSHLDRCRLISVQATGTDAFDLEEATQRGIVVSNVPDFGLYVVAEHAMALLLAACRKLKLGQKILQGGSWHTGVAYRGLQLRGKTLGIFGFGRIGQEVAAMAQGFQMQVIATTRNPDSEREARHGIQFVDFPSLLERSDYLVLAAPLSQETAGRFGAAEFRQMKRSAVLVNVARGGLVDTDALVEALHTGKIAGAGIDVFEPEPPDPESPLLHLDSVIATPHVGAASEETVQALLEGALENVEAYLSGRPQNVVNPAVLGKLSNSKISS